VIRLIKYIIGGLTNLIYLNNASTTKVDEKVLEDFIYATKTYWQNPSDISEGGLESRNIIDNARMQVGRSIGANKNEIVFTSGGTESSNWAIKGFLDKHPEYTTIITTEIEHASVYNTCKYLETKGYKVYYAPVDEFGCVKPYEVERIIINNRIRNPFVSIMFSNNEIGSVQPIKQISDIVAKYNGVFHVDAVQAFMHTHINVKELGIDLMSASFHKIGVFKNCGFLYIKDEIELTPLMHGGKQFEFRRSGTENTPAIYAFGNQVERLYEDLDVYIERSVDIHNYIIREVYERCGEHCEVYLNGHPRKRIANNLSFTFKGVNAEQLIALLDLKNVCVSMSSACNAGFKTPSRILKEIGLSDNDAFSTIRVSFDYNTTREMVDEFVDALVECVQSLKLFVD
jgi:cysteine desulfurase